MLDSLLYRQTASFKDQPSAHDCPFAHPSSKIRFKSSRHRPLTALMTTISLGTVLVTSGIGLAGCQDSEVSSPQLDTQTQPEHQTTSVESITDTANHELTKSANTKASQTLEIDWSQVDSGANVVTDYNYPFAKTSQPVKSYMKFFGVDATTAQHNLTVGMASNEALSRILDQLQGHYVAHKLTDGDDLKLIVYTTDKVAPSRYTYTFSGDFARGLTLPIVVQPHSSQGIKKTSKPD